MHMDTLQEEATRKPESSARRKTWMTTQLLLALGSFALLTVAACAAPTREAAYQETSWETAQLTTYTSYPFCCEDSPVYDPEADKTECEEYSGCEHEGDFSVLGHESLEWVKSHDLVAFYDDRDKNGTHFNENYGGKQIQLRKNGKELTAVIADTCGNQDCDNCCTENSQGGFLVDMEYWTTVRNLGDADEANGTIEFHIIE